MQTLGVKLRQERESRKLSLAQIAEETCISQRYLEAIEAGDLVALPGEFFYRAFVRQYAKYLGWNLDDVERQMNMVTSSPSSAMAETEVAPDRQLNALRETLKDQPMGPIRDEGISKSWLAFAAAVILGCVVYFGWQSYGPKAETTADAKPEAKTETKAETKVQTPPVVAETPNPAPPPVAEAVKAEPPAPQPAAGQFTITIVAKAMTWIRVTADGTKLYGGTIEAGQQRTFNARDMELIVGNAGTLDVIYNGKPLTYGNMGEVKTLLVTPAGWKFKPKAPPSDTPAAAPTTGTL
jgi:cytoskeleton protein RodZ